MNQVRIDGLSRRIALHRGLVYQAEERFYAELEKIVQKSHPERLRKREGDDDE